MASYQKVKFSETIWTKFEMELLKDIYYETPCQVEFIMHWKNDLKKYSDKVLNY